MKINDKKKEGSDIIGVLERYKIEEEDLRVPALFMIPIGVVFRLYNRCTITEVYCKIANEIKHFKRLSSRLRSMGR